MTNTLTLPNPSTAVDLPRPGEWSLTWRGNTLHESGLTGQHLAVLALITGSDDFADLNIDPRDGHQRLMMMLSAVAAVEATKHLDAEGDQDQVQKLLVDALSEVSKASVDEILGALTFG